MAIIITTDTMVEGQGGAREEPLSMFLFLFSYFLSTKLLFTFRTTAMMTNGPATTSQHLNTLKWWQQQQQLSVHLTRGYAFSSRQCTKCLARTMWTQSLLSSWWESWNCLSSSCFFLLMLRWIGLWLKLRGADDDVKEAKVFTKLQTSWPEWVLVEFGSKNKGG